VLRSIVLEEEGEDDDEDAADDDDSDVGLVPDPKMPVTSALRRRYVRKEPISGG